MSKRKIVIFKFEMYEEQISLTVAQHKGLQNTAKRECAKMGKAKGETAFLIFDEDGQCIWREQYDS